MLVNQRTGECETITLAKPYLDMIGLLDCVSDPDLKTVSADLVYEESPVDGEVDPVLRENAPRILEVAERCFGLVDCGLSIRGNQVKLLGGRTNPALLPGGDLPF